MQLKLDKKIFARIFDYSPDEETWLESEAEETFTAYLAQVERVIEVVDKE